MSMARRGARFTLLTAFVGMVWWLFDREVGSVILMTAMGQRAIEYISDNL